MKNLSKRAGISLVALIVTIIVLIILTAAVIVTFMEGGIIDRAKESVFKSDIRTYQEILAVKRAEEQIKLATGNGEEELKLIDKTITGEEIKDILPEFKVEEYGELIEVANGEIVAKKELDEEVMQEKWLIELGIGLGSKIGNIGIVHNDIIPEGGTYYKGIKSVDGPEGTPVYMVGDYSTAEEVFSEGDNFPNLETGDVYVYGDYEYRYNSELTSMYYIWNGDIFKNGWGVAVREQNKSEYGDILTTINGSNIISMRATFCGFGNLENAPSIPNTVAILGETFLSTSITQAPIIPGSVTDMGFTFSSSSIVNAPTIPSNVIYLDHIFEGCASLTGTIEINSNTSNYSGAFIDTVQPITLTGSSTKLAEIAATANNGNVTVATK